MAIMPLKRVFRVRRVIPTYRPAPLFRGVLVHIPILIVRKIVRAASIVSVMRHGLGMPWDMKRKWCAPAIVKSMPNFSIPANHSCAWSCKAGYYGSSLNGTTGCTRCPENGNSNAGTTSVTGCYVTSGSDATGSCIYTQNCYYSN